MSIVYHIEYGTPLNKWELERMREVIRDTEHKITRFRETLTLETGAYDADWSGYQSSPRLISQAFVSCNPKPGQDYAYGIDVIAYQPNTKATITRQGRLHRFITRWRNR